MDIDLIDTHAHLAAPDFSEDLPQVLERAKQAGVNRVIVIGAGYGKESSEKAAVICAEYEMLKLVVGLHPCDSVEKLDKSWLLKQAKSSKVVALGETGLDYYWNKTDPDIQKFNFRLHIEVAKELNLPLVIHSRNAAADCLEILEQEAAHKVGGVFHCYSEDAEFAKKLAKINFRVSFPGVLTFKKADQIRAIAKEIPLEQIMLETDCPFLAPQSVRGKRAEPSHVLEIAKTLAEVKELELLDIARVTTQNAKQLFGL